MARYIDADIAVAQIARLKDNDSSKYDLGLDTAINEIKHHIPTADVVEIVRYKDCKFYETNQDECVFYNAQWVKHDDDFCPYGERREDGEIR